MKHFIIKVKWFFKLLFGLYYDSEVIIDDCGKCVPIVFVLIEVHKLVGQSRQSRCMGICYAIDHSIMELGSFPYPTEIREQHIKLFNNHIASTQFGAISTDNPIEYWWKSNDKVSRFKYLDWLIDAYK